jgi:hypothetical protein
VGRRIIRRPFRLHGELKYGFEAVQGAFIVGSKQSGAGCAPATLAAKILSWIAGASALDSLGRSRTLHTNMRAAAQPRQHPNFPR